jgi:hypothetical protein
MKSEAFRRAVSAFRSRLVEVENFPADTIGEEMRFGEETIDIVALKDGEALIAEIVPSAVVGAGLIFRINQLEIPGLPENVTVRRAFVVPLDEQERLDRNLLEMSSIEVYGVSSAGRVERLIPD